MLGHLNRQNLIYYMNWGRSVLGNSVETWWRDSVETVDFWGDFLHLLVMNEFYLCGGPFYCLTSCRSARS